MSLIGWWTLRNDTPVAPLGLGYVWIRFSIYLSPRWGFVSLSGCPIHEDMEDILERKKSDRLKF